MIFAEKIKCKKRPIILQVLPERLSNVSGPPRTRNISSTGVSSNKLLEDKSEEKMVNS